MIKIYYAHPLSLYDTPQEERDIATLELLGFNVFNPNSVDCEEGYRSNGMLYFKEIIQSMNALAFRAIPGLGIPAGIASEINDAKELGLPIIELPCSLEMRAMSVAQTREYLHEIGQR